MPASKELAGRVVAAGRRRSITTPVLEELSRSDTPRQVEYPAEYLKAKATNRDASKRASLFRRCGLPARKTFDGYDWSTVSWHEGLGREDTPSLSFLDRRKDLALMGDIDTQQDPHGERAVPAHVQQAPKRHEDRLDREASQLSRALLLVIDELGLLPLDADGACPVFQDFADAYERQSVIITTNLELSHWGVFGDDQMGADAIDRVVHHDRLVQFRSESHRVRHASWKMSGWSKSARGISALHAVRVGQYWPLSVSRILPIVASRFQPMRRQTIA